MGGREASRGFLYQAIASVLEALCDENSWDEICVEFKSKNDKVDIALKKDNQIIKSIQVKSTENTFTDTDMEKWLTDLVNDSEDSEECQLILIGQYSKKAKIFMKSVEQFCEGDREQSSLKQPFLELIEGRKISFRIIPFDIETLKAVVRDSLHKYILQYAQPMTHDQIDFIASAMVKDLMESSTNGNGTSREKLEETLKKRIALLYKEYTENRIPIEVRSFACSSENKGEKNESCWDLSNRFDKRDLKGEIDWDKDIYGDLKQFLTKNIDVNHQYKLSLFAHVSISFATGRILHNKLGIDVCLEQNSIHKDGPLKDGTKTKKEYPKLIDTWEVLNENRADVALLLSISNHVYKDVCDYIEASNLPIGRIVACEPEGGASNSSVKGGEHAKSLANGVYDILKERTLVERKATLHIFASAPKDFMFFLGQRSNGFGKCIMYEYDFEQMGSCSYTPSMHFID